MSSLKFTPEELAAFREEVCKGASDAQFDLFISEAYARNLRPGTHLFFQLRSVNEWDASIGAKVRTSRATWITKIDAIRLISQRTGKDAGRGKTRWIYLDDKNQPVIESTVPLPHPSNPHMPKEPYACVVPIYRSDYKEPIELVCRFDAYAVTMKSGDGLVLTDMWQRRGPEQLEKCSECASRRAAYPEELGSLYLEEEFKPEPETVTAPATPSAVVSLPPVVPPVNQTPAVGVEGAQRPGETKVEFHTETVPAVLPEHSGGTLTVKPEPKKRGRKPKETVQLMDETGITDADTAVIGTPSPTPPEDFQKEGQAFAESVSSFTTEEAEAQGLPAPPDPIPSQEELSKLAGRVREFRDVNKLNNESLKQFFLAEGGKTDTRFLTVGDWDKAFKKLDEAKAAGTVKTVLENQDTQQSN